MEDTCGIRVQKNKNHLQLRELNRLRPIQSTHWGSGQKKLWHKLLCMNGLNFLLVPLGLKYIFNAEWKKSAQKIIYCMLPLFKEQQR